MTRLSTCVALAMMIGVVVAGCAAGDSRFSVDEPAGFLVGLWHGLIAVVAFILSLFYDSVEVYERANNGAWYDLGFLLGLMCMSGCGHRSHRKWRPRDKCKVAFPEVGRLNVDVSWGSGKDTEGTGTEPKDSAPQQ